MTPRASSQTLTDHDEIQRWAEERGAHPACVRNTGTGDDVGMIRLDFPGYSGADSLEEISWDEWFEKFDDNNLALIVQNQTARGQKSNFNKLVSRDTAEEGKRSRRSSSRRATSARGRASTAGSGATRNRASARSRNSKSSRSSRQTSARGTASRSSGSSRSTRNASSSRAKSSRSSRRGGARVTPIASGRSSKVEGRTTPKRAAGRSRQSGRRAA